MIITQGKLDCQPAEASFDESRIPVLQAHFSRMMERGEIRGASYCAARNGKVFLHGAVGTRHYEKDDDAMLATTVHPIASITKVFTAVAIMKLIEDGYTRLDVPVREILPQFAEPPYQNITLQHLLTHTSGIWPDGGCFPSKYHVSPWDYLEQANAAYDPAKPFDWLSVALQCGMRREPGQEWQYCSFGFAVLGSVIEALSGQKAEDFITKTIIETLQMHDTVFELTPALAKRCVLHNAQEAEIYATFENGTFTRKPSVWDHVPGTAGALCSTPYDLVRFGNMMLGNGTLDGVRILGRKTVEKMRTRALCNVPDYCWGANEPDRGYGIGFDMRTGPAYLYSDGTIMHEGAGSCSLNIDPKEGLVAAWFVPYLNDAWYADGLYNVNNILCSGLL